MEAFDLLKKKLHTKRAQTEQKIKKLEKMGRAGERYTAVMPDIPFLILALLCDAGWILQLAAQIRYLFQYRFHGDNILMMLLDCLSLIALLAVLLGLVVTICLNAIHEKEIATRLQKNLSFGTIVYGGLAAGVIGILQILTASADNLAGTGLLAGVIIGGFINFAFGLPIFMSFQKGIIYGIGISYTDKKR